MHLTTEPKNKQTNIKWNLAELKGKIGNWPIIVGDFTFHILDNGQNNKAEDWQGNRRLNNNIKQPDLTDIYKHFT